jgi:hypothetical protein
MHVTSHGARASLAPEPGHRSRGRHAHFDPVHGGGDGAGGGLITVGGGVTRVGGGDAWVAGGVTGVGAGIGAGCTIGVSTRAGGATPAEGAGGGSDSWARRLDEALAGLVVGDVFGGTNVGSIGRPYRST